MTGPSEVAVEGRILTAAHAFAGVSGAATPAVVAPRPSPSRSEPGHGPGEPRAADTGTGSPGAHSNRAAEARGAETVAASVPAVVRRYAPEVYLHPGESHWPSSAAWFIDHSDLRWAKPLASDDTVARKVDAARLGEGGRAYTHDYDGYRYQAYEYTRPRGGVADRNGLPKDFVFYLDLDNGKRGGLPSRSRDPGAYESDAPVYYVYRRGTSITYWFFYAYNDGFGPQNHEGDWEQITIRLNREDRPTAVIFHQHGGSETVSWADVRKSGETHPVVYSAKGSHASYTTPGRHGLDQTGRGKAWETWDSLRDVTRQPFYGFGGARGEVGEIPDTTGPLGPSPYKP